MITTYDNARFDAECQPLSHLLDLLTTEKKHDEIRTYNGLKLDSECRLLDGGATFTKHGFAGLAKLTSMPAAMVAWLSQKQYTSELARFVNDELAGLSFDEDQANRPKKRVFARFREDGRGNRCCRALFSDRYCAIDAKILVGMVADALSAQEREQARVHRLSYDGDELMVNLIWPGCDRQLNGEAYRVGVAIQTSEIGTLRMQISAWIGRLACENGLIVNSPVGEIVSKRHIGCINLNELATSISRVLGSALEHADQTLMQLDSVRKIEVADAERTIVQLGKDFRLTNEQVNRWLDRHEKTLEEPTVQGISAFSIINGLTSAAKAPEVASTERVHLESLAGRILAPRFEASLLEIEEHWRRIEVRASLLSDEVLAEFRS